MTGNFNGWLIKFGDVQLPNSFLLADGWESTPNQRVEINAWRDANVLLHRETADEFKTQLTLNLREMSLKERMALNNVIGLAELPDTDRKERRVSCTYWNDETLQYTQGIFYISDTKYTIHRVDEENNEIEYNGHSIVLTEY